MADIVATGREALAAAPSTFRHEWVTVSYVIEPTPGAPTHRFVVQGAVMRFERVTKGYAATEAALSDLLLVLQREPPPE